MTDKEKTEDFRKYLEDMGVPQQKTTLEKARESMHSISAALETDYPDNAAVWAHIEEVSEVINGTAADMLEALELLLRAYPYTECGATTQARAAIAKAKGGE